MPEQNLPAFQKSIGNELLTIRNRVRNLIGSAHRGEEGRYKESVLKKMIREYLPHNLSIGSWFIVSKNGGQSHISKQIDILIYDNSYPVVFRDGDFVIITQDMVKAIIEVKSKIYSSKRNYCLKHVTNKFKRLNKFKDLHKNIKKGMVFSWIFAYEKEMNEDRLKNQSKYNWIQLKYVNHISLWNDIFFKARKESNENVNPHRNSGINWSHPFFNIYKIEGYNIGYFLSNLLHIVSSPNLEERSPFSFTIQETSWKEHYLIQSIQIKSQHNSQD